MTEVETPTAVEESESKTLAEIAPRYDSVFADISERAFKYRFKGALQVNEILGGVPSDPRVIDGWLKTKLGIAKDDQIEAAVQSIMDGRGISREEAVDVLAKTRSLNGFMRRRCANCPDEGELCDAKNVHALYIEGRQLKAALKEAVSIAVAADRLPMRGWGKTNKWLLAYLAEHVMVVEHELVLYTPNGVDEVYAPTKIHQHFVNTGRYGSAIQYQEVVKGAVIKFTVISDHPFTYEEWGQIWVTSELQGIGASRSQSYGRHKVIEWKSVGADVPTKSVGLVQPDPPKKAARAKAVLKHTTTTPVEAA